MNRSHFPRIKMEIKWVINKVKVKIESSFNSFKQLQPTIAQHKAQFIKFYINDFGSMLTPKFQLAWHQVLSGQTSNKVSESKDQENVPWRHLGFRSNHPVKHKGTVVSTLLIRAKTSPDEGRQKKENIPRNNLKTSTVLYIF